MQDFSKQIYLVTGAASGIGRATVEQLVSRGATVVGWDLNEQGLADAHDDLDIDTALVNVTDPISVKAAVADIVRAHDRLDGVVHCAGIMKSGLFADISLEDHLATTDINARGTVIIANATLPHLRKSSGTLSMMGSISGSFGPPEFSSYGASKAFVINLAESLANEEREHGVSVTSVNPFFAATPMVDANPDADLVKSVGSVHTADEIAAAIVANTEKRRAKIFVSWRPRLIWALSRYLAFAAPLLMRLNWKHAFLAKIWSRRGVGN